MELDFQQETEAQQSVAIDFSGKNEIMTYDIAKDRQELNIKYIGSREIDELTTQIEVYNLDSIITFGAEVAEQISKSSDEVLDSMNMSQIDALNQLLNTLASTMNQFDLAEIQEEPGFLSRLFGGAKRQLERILVKYHEMEDEVEKNCIQLKKYENDIKESNEKLVELFQVNVEYYHDLVKYILASEQECRELGAYIRYLQEEAKHSTDSSMQSDIEALQNALMMLEQRTQDLHAAENIAMQSIPMIRTIECGNINLSEKINSVLIATLPAFKKELEQAILLKRQRVQAETLSSQKINEKNTLEQPRQTEPKGDALEDMWKAIMDGIEGTRKIQNDARKQRMEEQQKLENVKQDFEQIYHVPETKSDFRFA